MKITQIRGYHVSYAMAEPVRNALGPMAVRSSVLVELITDAGLSGWGETRRSGPSAWTMLESELARHVLGCDPAQRRAIWHKLAALRGRSETGMVAISAADIALWDLQGQIEGKPVTELLGGRLRDRVRAYLSGPFMKPGGDPYRDMIADLDAELSAGFTAAKIRAGIGPRADGALAAHLREHAGPDIDLAMDLNTGYTLSAAQEAVARCQEAGLLWIEEPVAPDDLPGYQVLTAASRTPIATGENLATLGQFAAFLGPRAVGLIQPDLTLCGGFTGGMKVAALAEAYATPVLPHVFGTAVGFAAALQFAAVLPGYRIADGRSYPYFEYERLDNKLRTLLGDTRIDTDGFVAVPEAPGLGLHLHREQLAPFTTRTWVLEAGD